MKWRIVTPHTNWLNSDLVNLQTSTNLSIVWLGRDLTIRRFSVQAGKQFGFLATDVGRPIGNVRDNLVFKARGSALIRYSCQFRKIYHRFHH